MWYNAIYRKGRVVKELLSGTAASMGIATGRPVIIRGIWDVPVNLGEGFVLVAPMTSPEYIPLFKKAVAVVTENGGRTCHAAIVSREYKIPCVVSAKNAMEVLKDQKMVTVDGGKGKVFASDAKLQIKIGAEKI